MRILLINRTPHSAFSEMEATPLRKQLSFCPWGLVVLREDEDGGYWGHGDGEGEHVRAQAVSLRRSRMVNTHKLIARQREMYGDPRLLS